ncbi:MAG TPA: hypothetical protein VE968_05155, partial [Sphingomicrobium sp.]|nr:hypothetical protein [Sphingomicrobium sp.]
MPFDLATIALAAFILQPPSTANGALSTNSAPQGTATTRYCMHVGPLTGEIADRIECWTREEWA